jgi:hypothetical protein
VHLLAADIDRDVPNLLEAVENLYLYMFDLHKMIGESENVDLEGLSDEALERLGMDASLPRDELSRKIKEMHPEFLDRLMHYAKYPKSKDARDDGENRAEFQVVAKDIQLRLGEPNLDATLPLFTRFVKTLGVSVAHEFADVAEAKHRDERTQRSAAGEFINMCKNCAKMDPSDINYHQKFLRQQMIAFEEWTPRSYQKEWAELMARDRNSLLVAPTNCGKTKVAAMCMNHLWKENPGSKIIFVAQNIPLVVQQMGAFRHACGPFTGQDGQTRYPRICAFGSFNGVDTKKWDELLEK